MEKKSFIGMRIDEAGKRIRLVLYLALENEIKCLFPQKLLNVKIPPISFAEFLKY